MAWKTAVSDSDLVLSSVETSRGSDEQRGAANFEGAVVTWGVRLDTDETTTTRESDGYTQSAAETWLSNNPPKRTITTATIDVGNGILQVNVRYVSRETVTTCSISRSSDAGSYRVARTIVDQVTTATKL